MGGVYLPEMSREVKEEDLAEALRSAHRTVARSPRGHVQMTSVLRGGGGVSQFLTIGGGGCVISILEILTGGGGVKNPEN